MRYPSRAAPPGGRPHAKPDATTEAAATTQSAAEAIGVSVLMG